MAVSTELAERLAFIGLDQSRRKLLADFVPKLEAALPSLLDAFYANIRSFPELAAFFDGQEGMSRASGAQGRHWLKLFSGRFDDEYVDSVRAIGLAHSRIGLEPRFYIGGYNFMLDRLFALVASEMGGGLRPSVHRVAATCSAINAAAMIDMDLAISGYIAQNKASYDEQLARIAASFEARVGQMVEKLAVASSELEATAQSMSESSGQANERTLTVAAAAEQASAGVQTVASAAEQLSASIQTITGQVRQADSAAADAVKETRRTQDIMASLAANADCIGSVIGSIGQIAAKTNMLALNASIEAARAGDAGRSFEVVAAEVKELAAQVERMTMEVDQQVRGVQSTTGEAVSALTLISETITRLSETSAVINEAITQQNSATADISLNIQQTARAASEVSSNIVTVSQATEVNGAAATQILHSATALSEQAEELNGEVARFVTEVRAA